jgi:hypothetical protein
MPDIGRLMQVADVLGDFLMLPDGTYGTGRVAGRCCCRRAYSRG